MNALNSLFFGGSLTWGPLENLLLRISLVLALAWLTHAALVRANPRWRVLLWRLAAVGVFVVTVVTFWGKTIVLDILPAEQPKSSATLDPVSLAFDGSSRQGLPAHGEFVAELPQWSTNTESAVSNVAKPAFERGTETASSQIHWSRWGLYLWVTGVVLGFLGELSAGMHLRRIRRRSQPVSTEIAELGCAIAKRLGCRRKFESRRSSDVATPCVFGVFQSVILLPDADCRSERRDALPAILYHESAHLLGGDLLWNGLLRLLTRMLWFHPLMWGARSAHLVACDAVCDATAASLLGNVLGYGQILAQLALRQATMAGVPALQMARPSTVRRRIEALHRRLYSARLARTAVIATIGLSLSLAGLCGALSIARAVAAPVAVEGLAVSGRITNEQDEPLIGATVYVHSAGVREGTSPFCPTCYADCGKRATTGPDGRFTIAGLNSTLVFQFVAVAQGHRPQFIKKIDPQTGASVDATLAARPIPDDPSRVVRGKVINPQGGPAVGALVEPFGCKTNEKRWWGRMDGVDSLAVTDERGEFVIVCDAPVIGLDLQIEARGALKKNFELIASGEETHRLKLQLGATVTGRVLDRGQPVAGVSIGICQVDRSVGKFLGAYQIGTDDEGRFLLANLPDNGDLIVYGIMNTFHDRGALPARQFTPGGGATTNLGDLSVVPGHLIRGRIALADGKPIPPHTRVMFSRDRAWDSNFVEAAADGTFSIRGIPPEVIGVFARIAGYRLSPKNQSFEPLNGSSIDGLVSGDVQDLVILYEPGETIRPDYRRIGQAAVQKQKEIRTQPLAGVTAELGEIPATKESSVNAFGTPRARPLPTIVVPPNEPGPAPAENDGLTKTLTGIVVDHQGRQVRQGEIWYPAKWLSSFESLVATSKYDGDEPFSVTFPQAWIPDNRIQRQPTVWTYAPGHGIGSVSAHQQLFGTDPPKPIKIEVPSASDISFVVLLPDGQPAVGAKVEPLHFRTAIGYSLVPRELVERVAGLTDAAGRAAMPALTREGISTIEVKLAGYGTQQFRCKRTTTDPPEQTLRLRKVGRVEGRIAVEQLDLTRRMTVSIETSDPNDQRDLRGAQGVSIVKVDEQGRFVIPEIAAGRMAVMATCDTRLPVRVRLPERDTMSLRAGETATLELPMEMAVRVHGVVRATDTGKPLPDVHLSVRYGVGQQGDSAVTNEKGEYSAYALAGPVYVHLIAVPDGYLQLGEPWNESRTLPPDAKEYSWPPIDVAPSIVIAGTLLDREGNPLANVRLNGNVANRRYGHGNTNADGKFILSGVPKDIELEKFEIWRGEDRFVGLIESKEPLVIRLEK